MSSEIFITLVSVIFISTNIFNISSISGFCIGILTYSSLLNCLKEAKEIIVILLFDITELN